MTDARASFPPLLASATDARHFAEEALGEWHLDGIRDEVRLLVSELVINAVLHAGTPVDVTLSSEGGRLRVEVSDGSTAQPVVRQPNPTSPTGRGLQILANLSDDWGVEVRDHGEHEGKTVWFELLVPSASPPGATSAHAGSDGAGRRRVDGSGARRLRAVGGSASRPTRASSALDDRAGDAEEPGR